MDRNNVIGLTLIFVLLFVYLQINQKTPEQIAEMKRIQDSVQMAEQGDPDLSNQLSDSDLSNSIEQDVSQINTTISDSAKAAAYEKQYGIFAPSAAGTEQTQVLENDLVKITFTNKGGRIKEVELKEHFKLMPKDSSREDVQQVLKLMEDDKDKFEYLFPIAGVGTVSSGNLYFNASQNGNTITYRADAGNGRYFEQIYTLAPDKYEIDYDIKFEGLGGALANNASSIELHWVNYLDKLEKSTYYERIYSSTYFKPSEDDPSYCSCTSDGEEDAEGGKVDWVSHSNQFFNASLMAEDRKFQSAYMTTKMLTDEDDDLKILNSKIQIPFDRSPSESFNMVMYVGPNDYDALAAYDNKLEEIIPFGRSVFGTINRWFVRPLFNFLSQYIGNKGIVILMLTLLVKVMLYPFMYKMLYSQSKMAALKPQLSKMREKFKDDQQAQQMESMKLYREFGVNPLGGCLPMAMQMPIWIALYRFFPASIEFRQASFLWAPDLSTFDAFFHLPFEIPFMGAHISLFTLLWAVTTVLYTYYNTKHMDMSAMNPAMRYMQYVMPIFFMGFFNSYASGLTAYLFFSNLTNVAQTLITKNFIIDQEKIKTELEEYRKKPKKKGGFSERLQEALKEQQRKQMEMQNKQKKGKKRKK